MSTGLPTVAFDDHLSELVGRFYVAASEGDGWTGLAGIIAAALESTSAILKLHGPGDCVQLLEYTDNLAVADSQQSWARHWHQQDLWVQRSAAFAVSRIVTDHDLVSPDEQKRSGFYREWLSTLDIHHMVGAVFPVKDNMLGVLGIHRPAQAGPYTDDDRRKVEFLLPHLQRALWLGQKMFAAGTRQMAAEKVLERIDAAVFVVDRNRKIATLNSRGESMLREANGLRSCNNRLVLEDPSLDAQLARLVNACIATASGRPMPPGSAMVVWRDGQLPLTLCAEPLHSQRLQSMSEPMAVVFVRDPEALTLATSCLRDLFGFTRTETIIAAELACGFSVTAVAARQRVGTATLRSHIKQILSKTGTHRLAAAVALIARSVAGFGSR